MLAIITLALAAPQSCAADLAAPANLSSQFGRAVSLTEDRLVVGAPRDLPAGQALPGAAHVYEVDAVSGTWTLAGSIPFPQNFAGTAAQPGFGTAIAQGPDEIFVSAPKATGGAIAAGVIFRFLRDPVTGIWALAGVIPSPSASLWSNFGSSLALEHDVLAVYDRAEYEVHVYERDPVTGSFVFAQTLAAPNGTSESFGVGLAVVDERIFVGEPFAAPGIGGPGAVHVFTRTPAAGWQLQASLQPAGSIPGDAFGAALDAGPGRVVAGAPGASGGAGAVFVFDESPSGAWLETAALFDTVMNGGDAFGTRVALEGNRVVASAPGDSPIAQQVGAVHTFDLVAGQWRRVALTRLPQPRSLARFGDALSFDGQRVVGSATSRDRVYVFPFDELRDVDRDGLADACESIGFPAPCATLPNGTGDVGRIHVEGSRRILDLNVALFADRLLPNSFGYFITSQALQQAPPIGPFGITCLGGSIGRFATSVLNSGASGAVFQPVNPLVLPQPGGSVAAQPGETWSFQYWHRDNPALSSRVTAFTETISVTFE